MINRNVLHGRLFPDSFHGGDFALFVFRCGRRRWIQVGKIQLVTVLHNPASSLRVVLHWCLPRVCLSSLFPFSRMKKKFTNTIYLTLTASDKQKWLKYFARDCVEKLIHKFEFVFLNPWVKPQTGQAGLILVSYTDYSLRYTILLYSTYF